MSYNISTNMPEYQGLIDKLMELRDIYKRKKLFNDEDS